MLSQVEKFCHNICRLNLRNHIVRHVSEFSKRDNVAHKNVKYIRKHNRIDNDNDVKLMDCVNTHTLKHSHTHVRTHTQPNV